MKNLNRLFAGMGTLLAIAVCHDGAANAHSFEADARKGLKVYNQSHPDYFFELHGQLKFDETIFSGKHADRLVTRPLGSGRTMERHFVNGANLRALEFTLSGGVGHDLGYTVDFSFEPNDRVQLGNALIDYKWRPNTSIKIGQAFNPFGLDNSNSSKWIPFLERGLPTLAFSPPYGLGVQVASHGDHWTFATMISQPKFGERINTDTDHYGSDRFSWGWRGTLAALSAEQHIFQVGASFHRQGLDTYKPDGTVKRHLMIQVRPEARTHNTPYSLQTRLQDGAPLCASRYDTAGLDAAYQDGPLLAQAEYMQSIIGQKVDAYQKLRFKGYQLQASYVLTGESHSYQKASGTFGIVKPASEQGAWEVAARYSHLDLNNRDVQGGKAQHASVSLGWYANENLRLLSNYIRADIHPAACENLAKRRLNILGLRAQLVW